MSENTKMSENCEFEHWFNCTVVKARNPIRFGWVFAGWWQCTSDAIKIVESLNDSGTPKIYYIPAQSAAQSVNATYSIQQTMCLWNVIHKNGGDGKKEPFRLTCKSFDKFHS